MRMARGRRLPGLRGVALVALLLPLCQACSKNDNTTLVNNGIDCGLVRSDLTGNWEVIFSPTTVSAVACEGDTSKNGTTITVNSTPLNYNAVSVVGSDVAASFLVTGDGSDVNVNPELIGSVQADSCLALIRIWITPKAFMQCLGTFDRNSRTIPASCDSAEVSASDGTVQATCNLNGLVQADVSVF